MKKRLGFDLIILGAPAAGKDTQAKLLEKKFVLTSVESGKYFRSLAKKQTKTGKELSVLFTKGKPSPMELVKEFLLASLNRRPKKSDLIFIGTPRLKPEAEFLVKQLNLQKRDFFVIFISLPIDEIWKRSAKRKRDDQDLHHVKERISWHKLQVAKTVNYFRKLKKLEFVNGNQSIKKVNKDILKAINDHKRSQTNRAPKEIW